MLPFKCLYLNICPFKSPSIDRERSRRLPRAFLMCVSRCLMNQSRKAIPSKSGLSDGILRWQQEVCKSRRWIQKGAKIVFPYKSGNGFQPTVAAVPSIFFALYLSPALSHTHLSSSVLFNGVNYPIRFQ